MPTPEWLALKTVGLGALVLWLVRSVLSVRWKVVLGIGFGVLVWYSGAYWVEVLREWVSPSISFY
jgi:hypothetical protein